MFSLPKHAERQKKHLSISNPSRDDNPLSLLAGAPSASPVAFNLREAEEQPW